MKWFMKEISVNMMSSPSEERRKFIKSSVFGLLAVSFSSRLFSRNVFELGTTTKADAGLLHERYPAIQLDVVSEVLSYAHFDLGKLKKIVDPRPELAKAVWDFGFGDWESAIAAGSHVGRVDIVNYLMEKGAAPTIFTYAMLGEFVLVKSMIEARPGTQKYLGPHGISLLRHAEIGLTENGNEQQSKKLIDYLRELGDADGVEYLPVDEAEKQMYLGDYVYDSNTQEGFTVKLNMRKLLSLGRKGKPGGALYKLAEHTFTYNGAPSVTITFNMDKDKVVSLTLDEPGLSLTAIKI